MICRKCHTANPEDAVRCYSCGDVLVNPDEMETLGIMAEAPTLQLTNDGKATLSSISSASGMKNDEAGPLKPGDELGSRYRIEALLGTGGMGAVYKARDVELGRTVALKVIRNDLANHPEAMQRFKQELLLASRISHKNILRIHDLVESSGMRLISMAYIDGEDLHSVLSREGRLPVERLVAIARQICSALDAAHSEGIIHRDIKPQNILIDKDGNVVVTDFGLAKSLDKAEEKLTHTGQVLGTPRYMSPEQVKGVPADKRSDLYAFGLILYEMATGDLPFAGDTLYQTMYLRTQEPPKRPKAINPDLPDFLEYIIMRCLEIDPVKRYQTAGEIIRDLQAGNVPAHPRRIGIPAVHRRRWLWSAVPVILLAVAISFLPGVRRLFLPGPVDTGGTPAKGTAPSSRTYIAVLPFRVIGDQAMLDHLAAGVGEFLSAKLYQLKSIYIPSFAESEKAAAKGELDKVARVLGVRLIVYGTIARQGEKIAIIANLQDTSRGQRLWTREFSGLTNDLLTLQDQIYRELLSALNLNPDSEERARTATYSTDNITAYDLYLQGRNALRGQQNSANTKSAISYFEKALASDPGFALAYVGLSDADLLMYQVTKDNTWAQRAVSAGEQAQRLNDHLPEVFFSLGSVYSATGKTAESVAILNRALQLAPNSDEGYRRLGAAYAKSGRQEEGIKAYQKAIEINPYFWLNHSVLGGAYFRIGKLDEALTAYRKVAELEPENVFGPLNVGAVLFSQGKYEECIPAFLKANAIQPSWETWSNLGTAYFYLKRRQESVNAFEKAVELNPNQELAVGNLADAYRWAGQQEKASATYDRAISLALKELEVNPRSAAAMSSLALYYAKRGNTTRALDFIRRARGIDANNVEYIYTEAVVRALSGQTREALQSLRLAFEKGYAVEDALGNPEMEKLQSLPEFKRLLAEFGGQASRK